MSKPLDDTHGHDIEFINTGVPAMAHMIDYARYNIPSHMWDGIDRYLQYGIAGDFLAAVICNDLVRACERADEINKHRLFDYCRMMYNEFPSEAWGSKEKFRQWRLLKRPSTTTPSDEVAPDHQGDHPNE